LTARPRQRRARSALERWRWRIEIRRREFLGAAALFFFAPGRALAAEADRAESDAVVRALCDRIVPKHGAHPGALALGVDRRVLEWFERQPRRSRALAAAGRLQALLTRFGSLKGIKAASEEEIARVAGFSRVLASRVLTYLGC